MSSRFHNKFYRYVSRNARALVVAEAGEEEESLGEASIDFFYGSREEEEERGRWKEEEERGRWEEEEEEEGRGRRSAEEVKGGWGLAEVVWEVVQQEYLVRHFRGQVSVGCRYSTVHSTI